MRKHTIIEHHQFKQILQYRPAVTSEEDRNTIKMTMLRSIIHAIGEKWARMKDETKSALEYLCFLSIERGFVYAGSKHVSERYDIDSSTVRRYIAFLEKKGVIKRLWRSSTKHNGRGKAVIFLTAHPYFEKYYYFFFLHEQAHAQTHAQAEIVENDRNIETSDEQKESVPYITPDFNYKKGNNHLNVNHSSNKGTFVKFVSKEVNRIVAHIFDAETLKKAWDRVTLAFKKAVKVFGNVFSNDDRKKVAIATFVSLKHYFMQRRGKMLADEICALAYSIAHKQFGQMKRERQPEIVETVEQKPVRTEALPDWFDSYIQSFNAYCENIKKEQEEKVTQDEIEELRKRLTQYA